MRVTFDHSEPAATNLRTFWFKPEKPVRYTAGQFTEIYLPHDNPDDRGIKRWFTLSSSPTDEMVSITTRLDPKRPSTFKQTLFGLKPGTQLRLADPMGDFVLPKASPRPSSPGPKSPASGQNPSQARQRTNGYASSSEMNSDSKSDDFDLEERARGKPEKDIPIVFVAGGIGVTPMHSMIKWLVDTGEKRDIHLFYAANSLEEVAFRELFEKAPIKFDIILTKPPAGWKGMSGRLTTDVIWNLPGVQDNALVYLSGPEPMVETFYKELKARGVPEHRLVTDYFPGYTAENV